MVGEKIPERTNPSEAKIVVKTKSVLISRMKKEKEDDMYKTLILRFFSVNNPHKQAIFPDEVITFTNTEKSRIMGLNVSFYLEGNDIVVNDLEELTIEQEEHKIYLSGRQKQVVRRK